MEFFPYVSVLGCELDEVEEIAEVEFLTFFSHLFVEELQEVQEEELQEVVEEEL